MSNPSDLVASFDRWLERGLQAATAMDADALERCTAELEAIAVELGRSRATDLELRRSALQHVRGGVTRWREVCLLAARTLEDTLSLDTRGLPTTSYQSSGAVAPSLARRRLVASYG